MPINRNNYLWVNKYLDWLLNDRRRNIETVDRYKFWLRHLLLWSMETPFPEAHKIKTPFSKYVENADKPLALESQRKIIETARAFFKWVKMHYSQEFLELPGYWIEDLTPPSSIAIPATEGSVKLEEAIQLATLPIDRSDLALWRDQAEVAMLFLSGARAHAAVTLPVCAIHLDTDHPYIGQWPNLGVHTKNNKGANTFLHAVPELLTVVREWDAFVREKNPPTAPWYAPISSTWGDQSLSTCEVGYHRSTALNKRLRRLFERADMPNKSPHKFRHGYAIYGLERCQTMGEYHALSRNLMHESIATTDKVYVFMEERERGKLLAGLNHRNLTEPDDELHGYLSSLSKGDLLRAINMAASLLVV